MKAKRFDVEKFFKSIMYSFSIGFGISIFIYLIWLPFNLDRSSEFPISTLTLGMGGLLLTISGCVGPGKYKLEYDLVIISPEPGSSFSTELPVGGFSLDEEISTAKVIINFHEVSNINFVDGIGSILIPREDIIEGVINNVWFEYGNTLSNKNYFTLFDYSDELTDEEIDEFSRIEENAKGVNVISARDRYIKSRTANTGSVSWGIFATSLIYFGIGIILDFVILK